MVLLPSPRGTEPPSTCEACARGCDCGRSGPGCGHYGCWGRRPTRDCPGVAAEEARYAALLQAKRTQEVRTLVRQAAHRASMRAAGIGIIGA